ncbi:hypothetical protein Kpol_526p15 [Vanderwaltozyma polyspora DSM 70294]|uniref:Chitin biosynthesis protein CHS5 n=1 Tax=Vanderwaltozyma polyspora (strain ATCC 22028 / DSM 70294 / BCRC 21397 / CBS 2163 / NBRC 10782 / NRRL Y-8283 / UCD 57-17) TaxID=436907 RepID=A7TLS0_VANPO|nr:uncharacterized protein Kpol_526p15 [Vanderwaltozyma polyspora DSM 70294]EDO16762.1 hypothetical protein Kpol_526p15 [Vanderwaltozyma polyspora DSM 70294]
MSGVEVLLTVGKLDASLALLTTKDHYVIEFPTMLLPENVRAGSIVKLQVSQNLEEEERQKTRFDDIQSKILEKYGARKPKTPTLKVVNVTQTSCVLAWDSLDLGSARLKSLVLYRQGVRSMVIPNPLKVSETKISGLSIGTQYEFQLKLSTTSGQLWSEKIKITTHKMTDMSGITVCLGPLDPLQRITEEQIVASLGNIGARPLQKKVVIDTTHFICNDVDNEDDPELLRAKSSNIPIVRPEWVRACELEKRIVGVRGFYLDADPSILQSYTFPIVPSSDSRGAAGVVDEKPEAAYIEEVKESNTNENGTPHVEAEVEVESKEQQHGDNTDVVENENKETAVEEELKLQEVNLQDGEENTNTNEHEDTEQIQEEPKDRLDDEIKEDIELENEIKEEVEEDVVEEAKEEELNEETQEEAKEIKEELKEEPVNESISEEKEQEEQEEQEQVQDIPDEVVNEVIEDVENDVEAEAHIEEANEASENMEDVELTPETNEINSEVNAEEEVPVDTSIQTEVEMDDKTDISTINQGEEQSEEGVDVQQEDSSPIPSSQNGKKANNKKNKKKKNKNKKK